MFKKILFALLIATIITCLAQAQTVDDIVNNMNKNKGSAEAFAKVQNWKMTGSTSMMGQNIAFVQYFKKPNMLRLEQDMMGQHIIQTFDGKECYPSLEEKAAHLLYFVIKDHPFVDGNKRVGAFLFIPRKLKPRLFNPRMKLILSQSRIIRYGKWRIEPLSQL